MEQIKENSIVIREAESLTREINDISDEIFINYKYLIDENSTINSVEELQQSLLKVKIINNNILIFKEKLQELLIEKKFKDRLRVINNELSIIPELIYVDTLKRDIEYLNSLKDKYKTSSAVVFDQDDLLRLRSNRQNILYGLEEMLIQIEKSLKLNI
jgi:hypothetical protein